MPTASSLSGLDELRSRDLRLPDDLVPEVRTPLGPVVQENTLISMISGASKVVVVGDVCAITFVRLGLPMDIAVVDYMTRRGGLRKRKELSDWATLVLTLKNPAATVSSESWDVFERAFRDTGRVLIEVEGEEDLLVIPAVLLAPQGARVIYGLPDVGLVVAKVDDALKAHVMERAKRMVNTNGS